MLTQLSIPSCPFGRIFTLPCLLSISISRLKPCSAGAPAVLPDRTHLDLTSLSLAFWSFLPYLYLAFHQKSSRTESCVRVALSRCTAAATRESGSRQSRSHSNQHLGGVSELQLSASPPPPSSSKFFAFTKLRAEKMPCFRGIDLSLATHSTTKVLPEFPHPDGPSMRLLGLHSLQPAAQVITNDQKEEIGKDAPLKGQAKASPTISVYVPSLPGKVKALGSVRVTGAEVVNQASSSGYAIVRSPFRRKQRICTSRCS
jgi:hypothetical protein